MPRHKHILLRLFLFPWWHSHRGNDYMTSDSCFADRCKARKFTSTLLWFWLSPDLVEELCTKLRTKLQKPRFRVLTKHPLYPIGANDAFEEEETVAEAWLCRSYAGLENMGSMNSDWTIAVVWDLTKSLRPSYVAYHADVLDLCCSIKVLIASRHFPFLSRSCSFSVTTIIRQAYRSQVDQGSITETESAIALAFQRAHACWLRKLQTRPVVSSPLWKQMHCKRLRHLRIFCVFKRKGNIGYSMWTVLSYTLDWPSRYWRNTKEQFLPKDYCILVYLHRTLVDFNGLNCSTD